MIRFKIICQALCIVFVGFMHAGCTAKKIEKLVFHQTEDTTDLPEILKRGKLILLAENATTSYFVFKGKKMGLEFEIIKEFAKDQGLGLQVKIVKYPDDILPMLKNGDGDLAAANLAVTRTAKQNMSFSIPYLMAQQVLVQRKPSGWKNMHPEKVKAAIVQDINLLARKKVHITDNSHYFERLCHVQDEIGDTIFIQRETGLTSNEELIEMVAEGLIDFTVSAEHIAKINQQFMDQLDVSTSISARQKIAFGMRKSSALLQAKLNKWLKEFLLQKKFKHIKSNYFLLKNLPNPTKEVYALINGSQLSKFDPIFKKIATKYDFDWRLLASVAYQESKFNPYIRGFGGAFGMMQFIPSTARKFGINPNSSPESQITAGMKKISRDIASWQSIPDKNQREKFALGTYNAGRSHIEDAQRLAKKYGLNPLSWDENVEIMVLNLSKSRYYRDPVVKNGALKNARTYHYVRSVYKRYMEWKDVYK